uniref:Evasin n=1 Tax=Amblyomma cajennense TaxID=34607 RepID=A0A023FS84_AMBCJ
MTFLWIFAALVFGAVVSAEKQQGDVIPGCGETAVKPKEREYGRIIDVDSCETRVLKARKRLFPASCTKFCPRINKTLPYGIPCLKFINKGFLLERADKSWRKSWNTCHIGWCHGDECEIDDSFYPVKCKVPHDRKNRSE